MPVSLSLGRLFNIFLYILPRAATNGKLMLESWYQSTAQPLVDTSSSQHNRLPLQQYELLQTPLITASGACHEKDGTVKIFNIINIW